MKKDNSSINHELDRGLPALLFDMDGTLTNLQKRWWDPMIELMSNIKSDYDFDALSANFKLIVELSGGTSKLYMFKVIWNVGRIAGLSRLQTLKLLKQLNHEKEKFRRIYPIEGAENVLIELKERGFPLALVTSASKTTVDHAKHVLPAFHLFDVYVCKDDVKQTKPHPEPLLLACSKLDYDPQNAVMIGDFPLDIQAGKKAGTKTIGIVGLSGDHTRPLLEDAQPDILIESLSELTNSINLLITNK